MRKQIAIIGGGAAGTAAAHSLLKRGYDVTIIEKNDRLGGRIHSITIDDATIEMGAGFISNIYPNLLRFLQETRLDKDLCPHYIRPGMFRNDKITMLGPKTIFGMQELSWTTKCLTLSLLLKALRNWNRIDTRQLWKLAPYDNHSISETYTSPAHEEFLEYVLQPALNAYFYWTPEHVSEAILILGGKSLLLRGTRKMRGGLQRIPEHAAEGSIILLNHQVREVQKSTDGYMVHVTHNGIEKTLHADGVVCATTATVVPKIIPNLSDQQRAFFEGIEYSSTVLVAQTYTKEDMPQDAGIAFPRKEGSPLSVVTGSIEPTHTRSPSKTTSVKMYASGTIGNELCVQDDAAITEFIVKAAGPARKALLTPSSSPLSTHVQRWDEALPLFDQGHFKKIQGFLENEATNTEPLVFAGDYLGGPFIEGAFTSGLAAAEKLDAILKIEETRRATPPPCR